MSLKGEFKGLVS